MKKSISHLIVLVTVTFASSLWAQAPFASIYQPQTQQKREAVKEKATPPAYRGPTLSTALPGTGRFSNGFTLAPLPPRRAASPAFQPQPPALPSRPTVDLSPRPTLSGVSRINSNDFARSIVFRSIYGDLSGGALADGTQAFPF